MDVEARQHLHCFVDAFYLKARETSCDSGRIKLDFHVEFDKSGMVAKVYGLDMKGDPVG